MTACHSTLALLLALAACRATSATDPDPVFTPAEKASLATLAPAVLPPPPADATNRYADDASAARLGQKLFFDRAFSGKLLEGDNDGSANTLGVKGESGKVACAGCHLPASGFLDDRTLGKQISLASGWGLRRTPSLLGVGHARLLMWDGHKDSLQSQIFGPLESANEMNSSRLYAAEQLAQRHAAEYEAIFGLLPPLGDAGRFPPLDGDHTGCDRLPTKGQAPICHGMPGDRAEYDALAPADQAAVTQVVLNAGKALGAYERLLSCGAGRFDRWAHGEATALTRAEQRGAALFAGKGNCVGCHAGPELSDQKFHNVGLAPALVAVVFRDLGDRGAGLGFAQVLADPLNVRGAFSEADDGRLPDPPGAALEGAFRTPVLRCVSRRPSFMHTGQLTSLEDVVAFFDSGGHPAGYPGKSELLPLQLSALERADLVAFLRALDGPGPAAALLSGP